MKRRKNVNWRPGTKVRTPDGQIAPISDIMEGNLVKVYTWEFGIWYSLSELVRADTGEFLFGQPKNLRNKGKHVA